MRTSKTEHAASGGTAIAWLRGGSWGRRIALVLTGTLFLAVCSWVEVPMVPVPMTMQTFGIVLIGALFGWRLGGATVITYLIVGAAGLPVFAGGASGVQHLLGETAGYLCGFVAAAIIVGWLADRGLTRSVLSSFAVMVLGHAVILAPGVAWLAVGIELGWAEAAAVGMTPFLLGMVVKAALATACLHAAQRYPRPADRHG